MAKQYKPTKPERPQCLYNEGVVCELKEKICHRCGWCPDVDAARQERIQQGRSALERKEIARPSKYVNMYMLVADNGTVAYQKATRRDIALHLHCLRSGISKDWAKQHIKVTNMGRVEV